MEVIEFTPSSSNGKRIPTKRTQTVLESNSGGEDNPMVSGIIIPMTIRVEIMVVSLGCKGFLASYWTLSVLGA